MPPAEMAYKPDMKYNFQIIQSIDKRPTGGAEICEKPKKTLKKFNKGSINRQILTKNFIMEFPEHNDEERKNSDQQ